MVLLKLVRDKEVNSFEICRGRRPRRPEGNSLFCKANFWLQNSNFHYKRLSLWAALPSLPPTARKPWLLRPSLRGTKKRFRTIEPRPTGEVSRLAWRRGGSVGIDGQSPLSPPMAELPHRGSLLRRGFEILHTGIYLVLIFCFVLRAVEDVSPYIFDIIFASYF